MNSIFEDEERIKFFAQVQTDLSNLRPNCTDEEIDSLINKIPKSYFEKKEDFMVIFSIFAYYSRNNPKILQKNAIKALEKIMTPTKMHLQNESSFIWNSLGSVYYLQHWMYEEGLISIEEIVQRAKIDGNSVVAEYFLPELFEREPELFEKEFKMKLKTPFSIERMNEFKELRRKHFVWIRESNDYNDPKYREIEKNALRLSIKMDDIDTFQTILSNSNISINSKIQESILENCYFHPHEVSLIDYAIDFNSIKIFKYLFMNGAETEKQSVFNSICNRNYEIIHLIESKNKTEFKEIALLNSIMCCNNEVTLYLIENYNCEFLNDENCEFVIDKEFVFKIIFNFCYSVNFQFFDSIFLPFLRKNEKFVNENINEIIIYSMKDYSCFFVNEFFKYPKNVNVNFCLKINGNDFVESFLIHAIRCRNNRIIQLLLNDPKIIINEPIDSCILPFHFACAIHADMSVIKMFVDHPKFDIKLIDPRNFTNAFGLAAYKENFYVVDFILKKWPQYEEKPSFICSLIFQSLAYDSLMTAKLLIIFFAKLMDKDVSDETLMKYFRLNPFDEKLFKKLEKILSELSSTTT